jgi:hypothetical protein
VLHRADQRVQRAGQGGQHAQHDRGVHHADQLEGGLLLFVLLLKSEAQTAGLLGCLELIMRQINHRIHGYNT